MGSVFFPFSCKDKNSLHAISSDSYSTVKKLSNFSIYNSFQDLNRVVGLDTSKKERNWICLALSLATWVIHSLLTVIYNSVLRVRDSLCIGGASSSMLGDVTWEKFVSISLSLRRLALDLRERPWSLPGRRAHRSWHRSDRRAWAAPSGSCPQSAAQYAGSPSKKTIQTECPKINRKSVLHLLKYRFAVYLSRCSTDFR